MYTLLNQPQTNSYQVHVIVFLKKFCFHAFLKICTVSSSRSENYGSMVWTLYWNFTEMEGHSIYLGITLMSTHRSQILMPGCIDWKRLAIEVEGLFNHQPFIDISLFVWCKSFSAVHWFTSLTTWTFHCSLPCILKYGLPLVMEKWFYCPYGTSTCRIVKCFHLMNAFVDRIYVHAFPFIIWHRYYIKWNCQIEYQSIYSDLPHGMGKSISDSR